MAEGNVSPASGAGQAADQAEAMLSGLARSWGLIVTLGVVSVLVGIALLVWPGRTLVVIALFFAAWLFVSGIFSIIDAFTHDEDAGLRVLSAVIGVLAVIVGFALLRTPFQALETLIFVIGIFWVVQGIMTFIGAFGRKEGRGWGIFMGILGIIAGIIVLQYPISSAEILALFGGIWLIVLGVLQIVAGWQLRGRVRPATSQPAPA